MPAVILSETSRHHCVSNSATSRNKDALHVLSQIYLHIYISLVSSRPLPKINQKTGTLLYLYIFFVILFIINRLRNTKTVDV